MKIKRHTIGRESSAQINDSGFVNKLQSVVSSFLLQWIKFLLEDGVNTNKTKQNLRWNYVEENSPAFRDDPASLPTQNVSVSEEPPQCKENQKSQNGNVQCSVVHVNQCYCLSYRMWKGFISCVVLIHLQDSVWIKFPILSVSLYTAISPHLRSPPQAPV